MRNTGLYILPLIGLTVLSSCSNTRFLTGDQLLYEGRGEIEIVPSEPGIKTSEAKRQVKSVTNHKVNNGFLGMRVLPPVGLWTYNYWQPVPEGKFGKWLHQTLAADPILISDLNPDLRAQVIENDLFNMGYFDATARVVIDTSRNDPKKARLSYHIRLTPPYHYNQIGFDSLNAPVDSLIRETDVSEWINPGDQFNLEAVTDARSNISRGLQNRGYFYFIPEFVKFAADTALGNNQLDLEIGRISQLPDPVLSTYRIREVSINVSKPSITDTLFGEPVRVENVSIYSTGNYIDPVLLYDALYFRSGDTYSFDAYQQTVRRLNNLGVFSYVRITYSPADTDTLQPLLDARIDARLAKNISLDFEADMVTKSTGFAGPALSVNLSHGNAFKGAEKVHVGLNGSFEWQWGKKNETQLGSFTYEAGLNSGITLPKILLPAGWAKLKPFSLQQTSVNMDVRLLNRTAYYQMASIMTNLNYNWGISHNIQHSFSPIYLNQVRLLKTTPEFDSVVNDNIYIRKSFEEQFILGTRYSFTYDNTYRVRPHNIFLQASVNTSGALIGLFKGIRNEEEERPWTLLNSVYSQYVKFTTDFRYYRHWRDESLVFRFYSGIGLPYRNSTVLPYVEQFFSGGAYSIRGFTARYLGPGSYYEKKSGYIDQSGDLKLEWNMEYRFSLSKILKGAFFLETGNIWLINDDENRPGAHFEIEDFYKELAVGTGVGLRLDFDFFVLRTDFGFPLRNPYQTDGRNWLFGNGDVLKGMLFYLAIGYPF